MRHGIEVIIKIINLKKIDILKILAANYLPSWLDIKFNNYLAEKRRKSLKMKINRNLFFHLSLNEIK